VSFNTFALDGGTTTFDTDLNTRLNILETTFDSAYSFTVNAFAAETEQVGFQIGSIAVTAGGSGYTSQPTVTISPPPDTANAIQATAGVVTIVGGSITAIAVGNPGRGYTSPPTITIAGGGGSDASATATITEAEITNAVSVFRRFTVTVDRYFNEPYQKLYIKAMPPEQDRALIDQLTQNQDIIPESVVYRADDPNFGVAQSVIYDHAYGLNTAAIETYVESLDINHYWKNLTLGQVKTAQALRPDGTVLYEVVYSEIIDNLVNNAGESVSKEVRLPFPVNAGDSTEIAEVYPNSLINMRDQVIDTVGQIAPPLIPVLPIWMTSKQANGRVLGFTPAWVIAYVKPGESGRVAYNIQELFGDQLNLVDYKVDRYELDRSQTYQWDQQNSETEIEILSIVGDGRTVTVTFAPRATVPFSNQDRISIQNTSDQRFNGWYHVRSCTISELVYDATTLGTSTDGQIIGRSAWIPQPPDATTFDLFQQPAQLVAWQNNAAQAVVWDNISNVPVFWLTPSQGLPQTGTVFDGGSTRFITPTVQWRATDEFDKYLVFPRINILE
jgi:hypothetical protein